MILSIPGGALFLPSTVRHHETHTWYGTSATTFFSDRFSWGYVCANDLGLERYYSTVLPRLPMSTKRQLEAKLVWEAQNLRSFHADAWTTGYNIIWKNLYCKRFEKNQEKTVFDFWNKTQIWTCWFLHRIFFLGGTARLPFGVLLARHQSHRVEKDPSPTWPSWMFGKLKADDVPDGLSRDHRRTGCKTLLMKQPKILTDLQGEFFFLKLVYIGFFSTVSFQGIRCFTQIFSINSRLHGGGFQHSWTCW